MERSDKESNKRIKEMRTNEEKLEKGDSSNLIYKNCSQLLKKALNSNIRKQKRKSVSNKIGSALIKDQREGQTTTTKEKVKKKVKKTQS